MPIALVHRIVQHGRSAGVAASLAVFLGLSFGSRPPDDLLQALVVILPAFQVAFFALIFATAQDETPHLLGARFAFSLWAAASFVLMWALVEATQASIRVYVEFGLPPIYSAQV
ncbi:hypothetical protein [Parvibaculum sp.]|uniref:hypothetical protein n=1 Tax=Parvibaculum sp. TaxID=2024848 RepID=UPI00391DC3F8